MEELHSVAISADGVLTAKRADDSVVAIEIQRGVVAGARVKRSRDREKFRFEIDDNGGLSAIERDGSGSDRIHPFFGGRPARICLAGQTYTGSTDSGHKLEVAFPGQATDLSHASKLLRRTHPRGLPASGIVLTARFADRSAQNEVRMRASNGGQDPWSPAWEEDAGSVVGAITISRLFHGNPAGRSDLARAVDVELPTTRNDAVDKLGVVWVSRIAVDAPYRGQAIGTELLRLLRTSIGATLPWHPRLIEVMQSVPLDKLMTSDGNFFTKAGYHRYAHPTYTAPAHMIGQNGQRQVHRTPLRSLYYWARIEST